MSDEVREYYKSKDVLYKYVSSNPLVNKWRKRSVETLQIKRGDTVVDIGCGTGANIRFLREKVGENGQVIGIDITKELLHQARAEARDNNWSNVHYIEGDATQLPVNNVDVIFSSFVIGMFHNSSEVTKHWIESLNEGGRIGILDAKKQKERENKIANSALNLFTGLTAANSSLKDKIQWTLEGDAIDTLDERVCESHQTIVKECNSSNQDTFFGGMLHCITGKK